MEITQQISSEKFINHEDFPPVRMDDESRLGFLTHLAGPDTYIVPVSIRTTLHKAMSFINEENGYPK